MLGLGLYHAEMAVAHLTCGLIAGLAVATRIYVKTSTKQGLKPDDHLILLTLLLYHIALITVLQGTCPTTPNTTNNELTNIREFHKLRTILQERGASHDSERIPLTPGSLPKSPSLSFTFSTCSTNR
jgi:hypothetical protein